MSVSTVCPGCGQRVQPPEAYQRRKMQCPACGVMCELPEPGQEPASASPSKPRPSSAPVTRPAAEVPPVRAPRGSIAPALGDVQVQACRVCGEPVQIKGGADGKLAHCPVCGTAVTVVETEIPKRPKQKGPRRPGLPPAIPPALRPKSDDPFESEEPYEVRDKRKPCPNCDRALPLEALVCTGCGYNLQTGQLPPEKTYERLSRHWETGLTFGARMKIFIAGEVLFTLVGLPGAILLGEVPGFIVAMVPYSALLAFLLGTFDRIDLSRNERGRVQLSKTWRCGFFTWSTTKIAWRDYEGISTGLLNDVDIWDWMIGFALLPVGIVSGIIWWYYMLRPDTFYVALCKDHGYPECMLYRGKNQQQAKEIAATIRQATGLPAES